MKVYNFKRIDSTNIKAKELALKGEKDFVVVCEEQTAGKGRFKRKWESGLGGLYFSICTDVLSTERLGYYNFISSLSVVDVLSDINVDGTVKWPNDVYVDGKKFAGILSENLFNDRKIMVIGIGMNINQEKFSIDNAISLRMKLSKEFNIENIFNSVLERFEYYLKMVEENKHEEILELYKKKCDTFGKNVIVKGMCGGISGKAFDINSDGELLIKDSKGKIHSISEGDVFEIE